MTRHTESDALRDRIRTTTDRCIAVVAKAPEPGLVKTRLCPPLTYEDAARVAAAALHQTLLAVAATPARRRVLVLDGDPGDWVIDGFDDVFEVLPQRGDGLAERLSAAVTDVGQGCLLIGMDTPQVRPAHLAGALDRLGSPGTDAVLGEAHDGGWWALGLHRPDPRVFDGVPMSRGITGARQRERLEALGLRTVALRRLRDVDRIEDAVAVAARSPGTPFAAAVRDAMRPPALAGSVLGTEAAG